jgi:hypothetical protein
LEFWGSHSSCSNLDWKAGVHTPLLAAVQVTTLSMKVDIMVLGYDPRQYNKFPLQRRYPAGLPRGSSFILTLYGCIV